MNLFDAVMQKDGSSTINIIEQIHADGVDLRQFIKSFTGFVLDIKKWYILGDFTYLTIPQIDDITNWLNKMQYDESGISDLLKVLVYLQGEIKYDNSPKNYIESKLLLIQEDVE